ncbi:hypothetical protein LWI29_030876 [Acer saccharum]|uniref:BED-type domain-containing protein n=1 Tax=Acer saccharum TaxID=4024 RepID=A0AA39SAG3_ACESA|nr:hypothetical protein LWI29_030876 [Acer saccharum]
MASGSGSGSGGDGSRNVNRGKGHVENFLQHIGDAVIADDVTFQQFIEDRFGSNQPSPPIPPEINPEFDGLNPAYNTPNVYENVSNPPPPSDDFFAGEGDAEEEKPAKSDLFKVHMKKVSFDGTYWHIQCNYCPKKYKVPKTFGYGTMWAHIKKTHPSEYAMANNQAQISRYATSSNQLFHYTSEKNREQLALMVATEHLPFGFGEKVKISGEGHVISTKGQESKGQDKSTYGAETSHDNLLGKKSK